MLTGGPGHKGDGEQHAPGLHRDREAAAAVVRSRGQRARKRHCGARNGPEAAAARAAGDGGGREFEFEFEPAGDVSSDQRAQRQQVGHAAGVPDSGVWSPVHI